jgi:hypothetical protein
MKRYKENRTASQQAQFESLKNMGYSHEIYKGLNIFIKNDGENYLSLKIFKDNASHAIMNYYYRSEESRTKAINEQKNNYDSWIARKEEQKAKNKLSKIELEQKNAAGEIVQADSRKSTALLKKMLKERFNLNVSIRSEVYSMGCSLNLEWELGCTPERLDFIKFSLEYGRFDGMQDLSYNVDVKGLIIDGYKIEEWKYVHLNQHISDNFKFKLGKMLSDKFGFADIPKLERPEQMNEYFKGSYGSAATWLQLIYQTCYKLNFYSQDESKINLLEVLRDETPDTNGKFYFTYSILGNDKVYDSRIYPETVEKIESKPETQPEVKPIETNSDSVQVIDYSMQAGGLTSI